MRMLRSRMTFKKRSEKLCSTCITRIISSRLILRVVRDSFSFLITSKEHGGPRQYYIESQSNDARMLEDRGYYFISEQSHYPHNSLPDDFHLGSDQPFAVVTRTADASSSELD